MRYDVFVSYSSIQRDWAEVLAHNLKGAGKTVFFDQWELTPGADWVLSLDSALDESRSAVLVASPEAQESGWVREEYAKLTRRRVSEPDFKIIPAVHSGAGHDFPFLGGIQWVDFRDPHPYAWAFGKLIRGLDGLPPGSDPTFAGALKLPSAPRAVADESETPQVVSAAVEQLFASQIVLILALETTAMPDVVSNVRQSVAEQHEMDIIHLSLPMVDGEDEEAEFFQNLGTQAGLEGEITRAS